MGQLCYGLVLLIIVLVITPASYAGGLYTITMKNGNHLTTSLYWEDSGRIMFYIYNGIMGLQKEFIETISEKYVSVSEDVANSHTSKIIVDHQGNVEKDTPEVLAVKTDEQSVAQRSDEYTLALKSIKSDFKHIHMMTTDEIYAFSSKISALKKKMIQDQVAHMYTEIFTSNSRFVLKILYDLCRKALSERTACPRSRV